MRVDDDDRSRVPQRNTIGSLNQGTMIQGDVCYRWMVLKAAGSYQASIGPGLLIEVTGRGWWSQQTKPFRER